MPKTFKQWIEKQNLTESLSRHCSIYKSTTGQWWMELADEEYGEQWDSAVYGPFDSQKEAEEELSQYSNPGGLSIDSSGTRPDPKKSPNGSPTRTPESKKKKKFL